VVTWRRAQWVRPPLTENSGLLLVTELDRTLGITAALDGHSRSGAGLARVISGWDSSAACGNGSPARGRPPADAGCR
jgi:hypothetical protein